jgi:hypothetical protein
MARTLRATPSVQTKMRYILAHIYIFIWSTTALAADTPSKISPGDVIRIKGNGIAGEYLLDKIQDNNLVVRSKNGVSSERINRAAIKSLEVRIPRSRGEGASRGAGLGFFSGVGIGIILGLMSGDDQPCSGQEICFSSNAAQKAALFGGLFGACGAAIGSITGALIPGNKWEKVDLELFTDSSSHLYGFSISFEM